MAIIITPESEYGKELRRWEQHQTAVCGGEPPGNPYVFRPYPRAMYKAQLVQGKIRCYEGEPDPMGFTDMNHFQKALLDMATLNQRCFKVVPDEEQERKSMAEGWRPTIAEAVAVLEQREEAIGNESANVLYKAQRMSEKARAELDAACAATAKHVTDVVPKRKRGRPAKGVQPVSGASVIEQD